MKINLSKYKWFFFAFSGVLVLTSVFGLIAFGLEKGVDFTGGTIWQIRFEDAAVTEERLTSFVQTDLGLSDAVIATGDDRVFSIKTKEINEATRQDLARRLFEAFGVFDERAFQSIGSVIGSELVTKAIWAIAINLVAISLYIAYAFRKVSYPVSSWKYAAMTLVTLFHNALIPIGLMAFLGRFAGIEIDINFIVAVLVVVGFSVHDTIVVFDRIRENLRLSPSRGSNFDAIVNQSINETLARSINTTLTLIIVLVALYFLGAPSLKYFILAILVGTVAGTYSSICVASPLLLLVRPKVR